MASITYSNAKKYRHLGQDNNDEAGDNENEAHKRMIKDLVHKQLSRHFDLEQLGNQRKFIKSTNQESVTGSTSGLVTYDDFRGVESRLDVKQVLKSWGFEDTEIQLLVDDKSQGSSLEAPDARRRRLEAIEGKLSHRMSQFERQDDQTVNHEQESDEEAQKLNPHQIFLANQLKEIADNLFPAENEREERGKKRPRSFESADPKRDRRDASCVYLREKPKTYWDMDRIPKIVKDRVSYPCAYPSYPSSGETIIRVSENVNAKGRSRRVIEVTKNMKTQDQDKESHVDQDVKTNLSNETAIHITRNIETKEDHEDKTEIHVDQDVKTNEGNKAAIPITKNIETKEDHEDETETHVDQNIKTKDSNKTVIQITNNMKTKDQMNEIIELDKNTNAEMDNDKKIIQNKNMELEDYKNKTIQLDKNTGTQVDKNIIQMNKNDGKLGSNKTQTDKNLDRELNHDKKLIQINKKDGKLGSNKTQTDKNTDTILNQDKKIIQINKKDGKFGNNKTQTDKNMETELDHDKKLIQINKNKTQPDKNLDRELSQDKKQIKINKNETQANKNTDTILNQDKKLIQINKNKTQANKNTDTILNQDKKQIKINKNETQANKNTDAILNQDKKQIQTNKNDTKPDNNRTQYNKNTDTKHKQDRTVIQVTRNTKADYTKPFILTVPESKLIPVTTIEANRVSVHELREMEKFRHYKEGMPSRTLYIKNLSASATPMDLASLMGHFEAPDSTKIVYRLMGGRMKGQAFVTFPDVETAVNALKLCNGYSLHGKPLVAAYGNKS